MLYKFEVPENIIKNEKHCVSIFCTSKTLSKTGKIEVISDKKDFLKDEKKERKQFLTSPYQIRKVYNYACDIVAPKTTLHYGQLKLFLTTLIFFKKFLPSENLVLIYLGSAHGTNLLLLFKLFPQYLASFKKIVLIDPAKFDLGLYELEKVEIRKQFFDDKKARNLKREFKDDKLVFMSDIRVDKKEEFVNKDMIDQRRWVEILQPVWSCLKTRFPWVGDDETRDKSGEYFSGEIIIQPYAPQSSTESRLIFSKIEYTTYDYKDYEDRFFTFNRYLRPCMYDTHLMLEGTEFDHCWDCMAFYRLIYFKNHTETLKLMKRIFDFLKIKDRKFK